MAGLYSSYAPEPDSIGTNFSRGTYTCCFGNFGSCAFSCGCSPLRHPGAFSRVRRRRVGPLGQLPRLRPRYRAGHVGRLGLAPRSSPPYRAGHVGPLGPFLRLRPRLHLGYVARTRIRPRRAVPLFRTCGFCTVPSPLRRPVVFSRMRRRRVGPLGLPPRVRIWLRVRHVGPLCPFLHLRPRLFSTSDACAVPMFLSVIARSLGCDGDSLPVKS